MAANRWWLRNGWVRTKSTRFSTWFISKNSVTSINIWALSTFGTSWRSPMKTYIRNWIWWISSFWRLHRRGDAMKWWTQEQHRKNCFAKWIIIVVLAIKFVCWWKRIRFDAFFNSTAELAGVRAEKRCHQTSLSLFYLSLWGKLKVSLAGIIPESHFVRFH